jgi:hypothetical protein
MVLDLRILNGACRGDSNGRYTFISDSGSSVNDYFIVSFGLFSDISDCCDLKVVDRIESDHMPLEFRLSFFGNTHKVKQKETFFYSLEKIIWDDNFQDVYFDKIRSQEIQQRLETAIIVLDTNVNTALDMFNSCLKAASECMKKTVKIKASTKVSAWFDKECDVSKKKVRNLLHKYRRTLLAEDRAMFCREKREYKHVLKRKEQEYNDAMIEKLVRSVSDQKEFWNTIHEISFKSKQPRNTIDIDTWFQHFRDLLERDVFNDNDPETDTENELDDESDYFNRPISQEEVLLAVRKLKNRKAAGIDGMIGELLKNAIGCDRVLSFLVSFFNALFDKGVFPKSWSESIMMPLYKKGNINDPNNYRGISMCDITSKLYSTIINYRLQEWVDANNISGEFQAGFQL